MNRNYFIERDVESAYGSDVSSNSRMETKKETFSIQESAAGNHHWFQWIKHKVREYMLSEALLLITIVLIIMNSYRLSAQNQETQAMISDFQMEFKLLRKQMVNKEFPVFDKKEEEDSEKILKKLEEIKEFEKVRVEPIEVPTNVRIPTVPTGVFGEAPTVSNIQQIPTNSTLKKFNAASFMNHAKVDTSRSSSSNLNPTFGRDQSNLVLVDRSESPADKAWCTYEKNPVLTVNLAKYTKPISVSYQHSNWKGTIPDDAPKIYDVMACLDYECEKRKPLVINCEYKAIRKNGTTEQLCNIPPNSINSPIGKIQFHFRRNYGNTEKTCVSLVRVYSEEVETVKEKSLADAEKCSALKYNYHNNPIIYQYIDLKNCSDLYSTNCCEDCPECCQECLIKDSKPVIGGFVIAFSIVIGLFLSVFAIAGIIICCCEYLCDRR